MFFSYLSSFPEESGSKLYFHRYGAYPVLEDITITPAVTTGYWIGEGRTTPILTNQAVGMVTIELPVTYIYSFGREQARDTDAALQAHTGGSTRRAQIEGCIQRVERGMLGKFVLNIGDGYRYQCLLTDVSQGKWTGDLCCVKTYTLAGVKTYPLTRLDYTGIREATVEVVSTVPRTDCRLTLTHAVGSAKNIVISINDQEFGFSDSSGTLAKAPVVLDGWSKVITMGSRNLIRYWDWTDFPYLIPGTNTIQVAINGVTVFPVGYIEYYPTFI